MATDQWRGTRSHCVCASGRSRQCEYTKVIGACTCSCGVKIGGTITRECIGSIWPKAYRYGIDGQSVNKSAWLCQLEQLISAAFNEICSINFNSVSDALYDGRRLHVRVV